MGAGEPFLILAFFLFYAVIALVPIVAVVLLFIWLIRKKRRDEELIGQLARIRETLIQLHRRIER